MEEHLQGDSFYVLFHIVNFVKLTTLNIKTFFQGRGWDCCVSKTYY